MDKNKKIKIFKHFNDATKEEIKTNTKNDNSLIVSTYNNDPNYNISYNEKDSFEEIYDENNDNNHYNNYLANKKGDFMKNNFLYLKQRQILNKIKSALTPLKNERNDNFLDVDYNPYRKRKKKNSLISEPDTVYKYRLNKYLSDGDFDFKVNINRFKTFPNCDIRNDKKYNYDSRKNSKFSKFFDEESGFIGNERFFQRSNSNIKEKDKRSNTNKSYNDNDNDNITNSEYYEENKNNDILILKQRKKKGNDLITEESKKGSNSESFDDNKYKKKRRNNINKNNNINLKTEDNDLIKERIKKNFQYSLNSENRKLKTSFLDLSNSRIKFINKKDINQENSYNKNNNENNNILSSSQSSIYIIEPETKKNNLWFFYRNYFIKREIFLTSFYSEEDNIPLFIRIPTFLLVMTFLFTINCLLLTTSFIHNRYVYAKEKNEINEMKYVFSKEIGKSFSCAIIGNIFKIICIKLVYGLFFKISNKQKEELSPFNNRVISEEENNNILQKREEFLKKYRKKSIIYIIIVIALLFLFGYICISYIGTFPNTKIGILLGFILSVIWSFIFCAFICLIIVMIYYIGKRFDIKCFITSYKWVKIIY